MNETQLLKRFADDGFAVWPQFLAEAELAELREQLDRYIRDVVPRMAPEHTFYEDKSDDRTLKQMQNLGEYDPWFQNLFLGESIRNVAECLLGENAVPRNLQYFSKPPGVGRPTPPHQDGYYFMLTPCEAITLWLAVDDVDEGNGCVRYVRGSHRRGMRTHRRTATLGFSQGIVDFPLPEDQQHEVAVPARAGDLLVHDAMTIHRADGNTSSDRSRRALGMVFYSQHARVDEAAHAAYRKQLQSDMKSAGRI